MPEGRELRLCRQVNRRDRSAGRRLAPQSSRGEWDMKRYGNLWDGMISFENLLRAANAAARGKRFRPGVARFFFHLERELWRLHEELAARTYRPGPYRT